MDLFLHSKTISDWLRSIQARNPTPSPPPLVLSPAFLPLPHCDMAASSSSSLSSGRNRLGEANVQIRTRATSENVVTQEDLNVAFRLHAGGDSFGVAAKRAGLKESTFRE